MDLLLLELTSCLIIKHHNIDTRRYARKLIIIVCTNKHLIVVNVILHVLIAFV